MDGALVRGAGGGCGSPVPGMKRARPSTSAERGGAAFGMLGAMKTTDLTVVSAVLPSAEAADVLLELLDGEQFTPTVWEDVEQRQVRLEVFLEAADRAAEVSGQLQALAAVAGVPLRVEVGQLPAADWAEAWKRFFHVERVSERVVIRPSWEAYEAAAGEVVITLDPGMSFGTGRHPTTRACLQLLDELAVAPLTRPVLDMGCGSGILSIAASKLGFTHVRGFDYDADAVAVARENAALNGLSLPFEVRDLAANLDQGAVVLANILGPVLIEHAAEVACAVLPGGALVASGILETLYAQVRAAFEAVGLRERKSVLIGEWRSGLFVKPEETR